MSTTPWIFGAPYPGYKEALMALANKIIVPMKSFSADMEIFADRSCPDDKIYVVDGNGHVFCYENTGRVIVRDDETDAD